MRPITIARLGAVIWAAVWKCGLKPPHILKRAKRDDWHNTALHYAAVRIQRWFRRLRNGYKNHTDPFTLEPFQEAVWHLKDGYRIEARSAHDYLLAQGVFVNPYNNADISNQELRYLDRIMARLKVESHLERDRRSIQHARETERQVAYTTEMLQGSIMESVEVVIQVSTCEMRGEPFPRGAQVAEIVENFRGYCANLALIAPQVYNSTIRLAKDKALQHIENIEDTAVIADQTQDVELAVKTQRVRTITDGLFYSMFFGF